MENIVSKNQLKNLLGIFFGFVSGFLFYKNISKSSKSPTKVDEKVFKQSKLIKERKHDNLEKMGKRELVVDIHVAEYNSMRRETELLIDVENRLVNYGVLILGGLLTVYSIFSTETYLLLIASMLLSSISWGLVETEVKIHDIGNYLRNKLIPRIQKITDEENVDKYLVFQWSFSRNRNIFRILLRGITGMGKFFVSFIPSVLLCVIFYIENESNITGMDPFERTIFIVSALMVVAVPSVLLLNIISNLITSLRDGGWKKYIRVSKSNK
ncbi:MAG: hypothetical protein HON98_03440 [Chloroflexi bacterium]|jgi:hypothetical protein|nr:hypothetical protein [Chloroflexota bacterium]MBT3670412.1 hypothetical protein [Chloroflexota bacterium]MBT4003214.1 hypothetical protein [Chloroflexota bacterium]MBT4304627.1 hypothetical protein [Chloroflexota bacterium]MBT4532558.1 hypothetical protein [Chloroflexota bacterium]